MNARKCAVVFRLGMPGAGIEPACRYQRRGILSALCLPISPPGRWDESHPSLGYNLSGAPSRLDVSSPVSRRARVAVWTNKSEVGNPVVFAIAVDKVEFERNVVSKPCGKPAHLGSSRHSFSNRFLSLLLLVVRAMAQYFVAWIGRHRRDSGLSSMGPACPMRGINAQPIGRALVETDHSKEFGLSGLPSRGAAGRAYPL